MNGVYRNQEAVFNEIANEVAKATEAEILKQLNEFISRGLIIVEVGQPMLVQDIVRDSTEVRITRGVRLVLKDQEYIQNLESTIAELKKTIHALTALEQKGHG